MAAPFIRASLLSARGPLGPPASASIARLSRNEPTALSYFILSHQGAREAGNGARSPLGADVFLLGTTGWSPDSGRRAGRSMISGREPKYPFGEQNSRAAASGLDIPGAGRRGPTPAAWLRTRSDLQLSRADRMDCDTSGQLTETVVTPYRNHVAPGHDGVHDRRALRGIRAARPRREPQCRRGPLVTTSAMVSDRPSSYDRGHVTMSTPDSGDSRARAYGAKRPGH